MKNVPSSLGAQEVLRFLAGPISTSQSACTRKCSQMWCSSMCPGTCWGFQASRMGVTVSDGELDLQWVERRLVPQLQALDLKELLQPVTPVLPADT